MQHNIGLHSKWTIMKNKRYFSLIELILSFVIISIIAVIMLRYYTFTLETAERAAAQVEMQEDARMALQLISDDISSLYVGTESDSAPFLHYRPASQSSPPSLWGAYGNEMIAFISSSPILPNSVSISELSEVKYQLYYGNDDKRGWLRRSVTSDSTTSGVDKLWNFYNNSTVSYDDENKALTITSASSQAYQRLIPHVTKFQITSIDSSGNEITPDDETTIAHLNKYPNTVIIEITTMDKNSWQQWIALGGEVNAYYEDSYNVSKSAANQTAAYKFRKGVEKTFSKVVYIGDR